MRLGQAKSTVDAHSLGANRFDALLAVVLQAVQDHEAVPDTDRLLLCKVPDYDDPALGPQPSHAVHKATLRGASGLAVGYPKAQLVGDEVDSIHMGLTGEYARALLSTNPQLEYACCLLAAGSELQVHHCTRALPGELRWPCRWKSTGSMALTGSDGGLSEAALRWVVHWAYSVVALGKAQRKVFNVPEMECDVQLESVLGVGGSATVYRVSKVGGTNDDVYALKLFLDDHSTAAQERDVLRGLQGAAWAPAFLGGVYAGCVMEQCQPLTRLTRAKFRQLMAALRELHTTHELCHRDIKPDNLAERDGQLVLLDFAGSVDVSSDAWFYHGTFTTASDAVLSALGDDRVPVPCVGDDVEAAIRTAFLLTCSEPVKASLDAVASGDYRQMLMAWARVADARLGPAYAAARGGATAAGAPDMYDIVADCVCTQLLD